MDLSSSPLTLHAKSGRGNLGRAILCGCGLCKRHKTGKVIAAPGTAIRLSLQHQLQVRAERRMVLLRVPHLQLAVAASRTMRMRPNPCELRPFRTARLAPQRIPPEYLSNDRPNAAWLNHGMGTAGATGTSWIHGWLVGLMAAEPTLRVIHELSMGAAA